LCDAIVDLVETGRTLRDNGLSIIEVITESTARFAVNRASYQLKAESITRLLNALEQIVNGVPA
jgi:ATP phosphoribosyltransferase